MFDRLFKRSAAPEAESAPSSSHHFDDLGVRYRAPAGDATRWLSAPYEFGEAADLGARLQQVFLEGFGERAGGEFVLPWADLYRLLAHPELLEYRAALCIPADTSARPRLLSRGALSDPDFAVYLDDWCQADGSPLQPKPTLRGRVLASGDALGLLPEPLSRLLGELAAFHAVKPADRSLAFKEQAFGRMRRLALECGCQVSDYVARTIVLTPERLRLDMAPRGEGEARVIELLPDFDGAPARWLELFDRLPLQESYDVPDGPSMTRVVLTAETKSTLAAIKQLPGRRVAGPRAQALVRNPVAVLGESAQQVIDLAQFEKARVDAGLHFTRFTPHVSRGASGQVEGVYLLTEALEGPAAEAPPTEVTFESVASLAAFCDRMEGALEAGAQCVSWRGQELELIGDAPEHLQQMRTWLRQWIQPALWTADEVLDLSNYSSRIEAIGEEQPLLTPVIVRNDKGADWFESNVSVGLQLRDASTQSTHVLPLEFNEIPSLQQAVLAAEDQGQTELRLPGAPVPVPINEARRAVEALMRAALDVKAGKFDKSRAPAAGSAKTRLVLKPNLFDIDYDEGRADSLAMPEGREPCLPKSLKADVSLKEHQRLGVAWLQHLWEASPHRCRGTVLADDMGLGKTLQLLTFLASCFERDPDLPPALVVAPVALLENWRSELDRFFEAGTLQPLTLYGDALRALRVNRHEVDADLAQQGVTRLLKKHWIGKAKLVLTTYETMRDLEFALAAQQWSVMVCDEAQKIKTPSAMVTRSAKKQKVRFRIACTGTPVENTLADLWCLFDFVQPGLLGALNHFSKTYRQPIEANTPEQKAKVEELRALIQPQILHRKKTEVARDLLVPIEDHQCKQLPMSPYQQQLYAAALKMLNEQRMTNPSAQLQALQAIRKICSDPHGHAEPSVRDVSIQRLINESPKLGWLVGRLKALASAPEADHKVILFCEFRELQLTLQRVVAAYFGFAPSIVNGDTTADPKAQDGRQQLIDAFQRKTGFNVIILSPVAVGFGVNIQAANHVIHFTRTWNPAKEDQATARAYRIGQRRQVTVYYPGVVSDHLVSFDVILDKRLSDKRALAADMLNGCGDLKASDFAEVA